MPNARSLVCKSDGIIGERFDRVSFEFNLQSCYHMVRICSHVSSTVCDVLEVSIPLMKALTLLWEMFKFAWTVKCLKWLTGACIFLCFWIGHSLTVSRCGSDIAKSTLEALSSMALDLFRDQQQKTTITERSDALKSMLKVKELENNGKLVLVVFTGQLVQL